MKKVLFLSVLMICLLALLPPQVGVSAQVENAWIELMDGSVYKLRPVSAIEKVFIPVRLDPEVNGSSVTLSLIDVSHNQVREVGLSEAFSNFTMSTVGQGIQFEVQIGEMYGPGTYSLIIEARTQSMSDPVFLQFQLIYPPAILRQPDTIVVEQIRTVGGPTKTIIGPLILRETSNSSSIFDIQIIPLVFFDEKNRPISGTFDPMTIVPEYLISRQIEVSLNPNGEFPLGTSKGAIQIVSPQLVNPVDVNVEVNSRFEPYVLLVIPILIGLLVGYIGRNLLQSRRDLLEARLKGQDLLGIIKTYQGVKEKTFSEKLNVIINKMEKDLVEIKKPSELQEKFNEYNNDFQTVLTDLKSRRQVVESRLNELDVILKEKLALPHLFLEKLTNNSGSIEVARKSLAVEKIDEAEDIIDQTFRILQQDLADALMEWRSLARTRLTELEVKEHIPLPVDTADKLSKAVPVFQKYLDRLDLFPVGAEQQGLLNLLQMVRRIQWALHELGLDVYKWLIDDWAILKQILHDEPDIEFDLSDIKKTIDEELPHDADGFKNHEVLECLSIKNLIAMEDKWKKPFEHLIEVHHIQNDQELKDHLSGRAYSKAARRILEQVYGMGDAQTDLGERVGGLSTMLWQGVNLGEPEEYWRPLSTFPSTSVQTVLRFPYQESPMDWISRSSTSGEIGITKTLQWLISVFGILIVGYLLFSPNFIGTLNEILVIFMWAFGLDITIDTFLELSKSVKSSA